MLKESSENSNSNFTPIRDLTRNTKSDVLKNTPQNDTLSLTSKGLQLPLKKAQKKAIFYHHLDYLRIKYECLTKTEFYRLLSLLPTEYSTLDETKRCSLPRT
jgi:hypothetical protein